MEYGNRVSFHIPIVVKGITWHGRPTLWTWVGEKVTQNLQREKKTRDCRIAIAKIL